MKFEIKNRWNGALIFECDADSMKLAVELAVSQKVSLSAADLRDADLRAADLSAANLRAARIDPRIPVVPGLHQKMLDAIAKSEDPGGGLDMGSWHTCETMHCRAGWAITLAGDAGRALEYGLGPAMAGALITLASCPWMEKVPDFHSTNEEAMEDIKACAEREAEV